MCLVGWTMIRARVLKGWGLASARTFDEWAMGILYFSRRTPPTSPSACELTQLDLDDSGRLERSKTSSGLRRGSKPIEARDSFGPPPCAAHAKLNLPKSLTPFSHLRTRSQRWSPRSDAPSSPPSLSPASSLQLSPSTTRFLSPAPPLFPASLTSSLPDRRRQERSHWSSRNRLRPLPYVAASPRPSEAPNGSLNRDSHHRRRRPSRYVSPVSSARGPADSRPSLHLPRGRPPSRPYVSRQDSPLSLQLTPAQNPPSKLPALPSAAASIPASSPSPLA
mgnify:FL=1